MKRRLFRCPEPGCEAAFLKEIQLRGHMQVHAMDPQKVQKVIHGP